MPFLWHVCSSKTRPVLPNWLRALSPQGSREREVKTRKEMSLSIEV